VLTGDQTVNLDHIREAAVGLLVQGEHLKFFRGAEGLSLFGTLCEVVGISLQHLAADRPEQAANVVERLGMVLPRAFPESPERSALEEALSEYLLVIQASPSTAVH